MQIVSLCLEHYRRPLRIFLISVFALVLGSCKITPPRTELCILGDAGLLCRDERLPKDEQECVRRYPGNIDPLPEGFKECEGGPINYIATNPDDYDLLQAWYIRNCRR